MQTPKRPIGLFGGAFDPPHLGHRYILDRAAKRFGISEWIIMPTGQAVHRDVSQTPSEHRFKMCQLAFAHSEGLEVQVSDFEIQRSQPSYTTDTLSAMQSLFPNREWFVLIGQDQWDHFQSWKNWRGLLNHAHFIVARRNPDSSIDLAENHANSELFLLHPNKIHELLIEPHGSSSTQLRAELKQNNRQNTNHPWLDPSVQGYITQHHLYAGKT